MVRLDDIVLFGPGSEWLWAMGEFVVVALTGLAIYRQLRAQRSGNLVEHMTEWDREFESIEMTRAKLGLVLAIQARDPSRGFPREQDEVADFFERLGYLVHRGHVNADDFWNDGGWLVVQSYWGLVKPYIDHDRATGSDPELYHWFEWLDGDMRRLDAKHGKFRAAFEPAQRDELIASKIEIFRAKLRRADPSWPMTADAAPAAGPSAPDRGEG